MKAAEKLHDDIIRLLLRDFGAKPVNRNLKTFTHHVRLNEKDKETFTSLCDKYHIDVESEYPAWLLDYYRHSIMKVLDDMMHNLKIGYTMYIDITNPNAMNEFRMKREAMWRAISDGYELLYRLQSVIRQLPVDANKYMSYTDRILKEIELMKERRTADNKIAYMIRDYQEKRSKQA